MATDTTMMTADELLKMPHNGYRYELVRGELIQMSPAGSKHGAIAARIGWKLGQFVEENNLGQTYAAETGFIIDTHPDTVRAPDASFVTKARIDQLGEILGFFPGPPDLAVEVISPNDTYTQVADKAMDWLRAGAEMVIVIDPIQETVTLYYDLNDIAILTKDQTLTGGDLLPNWSLPLRDLFK